MFCTHCGEKLEENATVCPNCGALISDQEVESPKKAKLELQLSPISAVGVVMSAVAFLFGLVFMSISLARRGSGITWIEYIALLPAWAGLGIGVHQLVAKKEGKHERIAAWFSICATLFVLLYTFIGFCAIIA